MATEVISEGTPPPEVSLAPTQDVTRYIKKVVTALFDCEPAGALELALNDRNHLDSVQKFISDSQIRSLLVQSSSAKGNFNREVKFQRGLKFRRELVFLA